eukprot:6019399-Prymnesium_polylepis.1
MNPVAVHCDNEAAVSSINKVGAPGRTRHYDIWLTYGREKYLSRISPGYRPDLAVEGSGRGGDLLLLDTKVAS